MSIEYLREYGDMEPGDYDGTALPLPPPREERQRERDR